MAKKKSKKVDVEKKAALQAKKDAKQDKAARKRLQKDAASVLTGGDADGEAGQEGQLLHFEALLEQYKKSDQVGAAGAATNSDAAYIETLDSFPLARANATWTLYDDDTKKKKRNAEVFLFGGEYYDGVENIVLNHLLKYNVSKREWKRIHAAAAVGICATATGPPARCAHSTVYYNHALYVFGGEYATADEYHHYKDLWRFDIKAQSWQEIKSTGLGGTSSSTMLESSSSKKKKDAPSTASTAGLMLTASGTPPSARSGHVAVVWKHYMIIFGGFYEAMRDTPRWYNDVAVLNLKTLEWLAVPHSKLSSRPEPRSACNADVIGDDLIIHGGFSKLVNNKYATLPATNSTPGGGGMALSSETRVHSDAWMLHLKPLLSDKPPTWERLTSSSRGGPTTTTTTTTTANHLSPNGRAGTSSVAYRDRVLLAYGGVIDHEQHHHKMNSIFYNDLFCLDVARRKWFPLHTKSKSATPNTQSPHQQGNDANQEDPDSKDKKTTDGVSSELVEKDNTDDENDEDEDDDSNDGDDFLQPDDNPIENESSKEHQGWDLEKLRSNMFAFIDGDGHLVYEKMEDSDDDDDDQHDTGKKNHSGSDSEEEEEKEEEREEAKEDEDDEDEAKVEEDENDDAEERASSARSRQKQSQRHNDQHHHSAKVVTSSSVMVLNPETNIPEAVVRSEPLPRINSSLVVVNGDTLLVYGGLVEVGDREVTLDDMWSLDLRKREHWECVWPGTMHKQVWRGAMHDDDDSYYSSSDKPSLVEDDDDDEDDDEASDTPTAEKSKSKPSNSSRELIAQLKEQHGLADKDQTPEPGEALAEFYSRTSIYWNEKAAETLRAMVEGGCDGEEDAVPNKKEIKREGFGLAKKRYEDLEPIMKQLGELDMSSSSAKKEKSGSKDRSERKEKKKENDSSRKGGRRR